jgi:hypothetical protein
MERVLNHIDRWYNCNDADYFNKDDHEYFYNTPQELLEKSVEKLTSRFVSDFEITNTKIYPSGGISIKFSYKGYLGELSDIIDSNGYNLWVVDFINE